MLATIIVPNTSPPLNKVKNEEGKHLTAFYLMKHPAPVDEFKQRHDVAKFFSGNTMRPF